MRGTGIGTSIFLIAVGAILAFAVTLRTNGIDLNTVGLILMLVGLIGLVFSFLAFESLFGGTVIGRRNYYEGDHVDELTPPHEHRRVETRDVVYEDDDGTTVERVRRTRRL